MRTNLILFFGFSLFVSFFCFGSSSKVTFQGHQVLRLKPSTAQHLNFLKSEAKNNLKLDFWTDSISLKSFVDVRVTPEDLPAFQDKLRSVGLKPEVFIQDVQTLVDKQHLSDSDDFYSKYHSYEEIQTWAQQLAKSYPNLVKLIKIGTSYEGRDLTVLRLTSGGTAKSAGFWFDGCIHAREWITTATVLYMVNQLATDYTAGNETVVNLLNNLEIYVMPVFNVDGYAYTWNGDRMWRKTRSQNSATSCVGTDPNRNWDNHWGGAGSDSNPCSESYAGASPFSEIEVKTVANYIYSKKDIIKGYINFHSYSQLWMSPYGWTDDYPPDYDAQNDLSKNCVDALQAVHGTSYTYGPIATTIYPAAGNSADWTYQNSSIVYSYGVELRDNGRYGFLLPANQIVPSGEETYAALLVFGQTILKSSAKPTKIMTAKLTIN